MLVLGSINQWGASGQLIINHVSHPFINQILTLVFILFPFSVLFGWVTVKIMEDKLKGIVRREYEAIPKREFEATEVILGEDSVTVRNMFESATYAWSLIGHPIKTEEYLYLVRSGGRRITSIPLSCFEGPDQIELAMVMIATKTIKPHHAGERDGEPPRS